MHDHVVALMVVAGFLVGCGDSGTASIPPSDHSAVPDDSDVPEEGVAPNDADVPSETVAPPRGGQAPPPAAPGGDSGVRNCSRLCEHELRFSCDIGIPQSNCASTCTESVATDPCGVEATSALLCLLDQGVCPEQEAAESVCVSALERYGRCANATGGEEEPDETLD